MESELSREKRGGLTAQFLGFVAGFVDAVGFIVLMHMFTANMSGNTIVLGIDIAKHHWAMALHRGFPIPVFILGGFFGSLIIEISSRRGFRHVFSILFFTESFFIGLFLLFGGHHFTTSPWPPKASWYIYALAALPSLAMGLQTAVLYRVGSLALRTTFITGMLMTFSKELSFLILGPETGQAKSDGGTVEISRRGHFLRMIICGGVWVFYFVGAAVSIPCLLFWGINVLVIPIFILFVLIIINLLTEEKIMAA
ncbi:MAG: YoaK family protein [Smithella sp.]